MNELAMSQMAPEFTAERSGDMQLLSAISR
jgi:hypothetical protein